MRGRRLTPLGALSIGTCGSYSVLTVTPYRPSISATSSPTDDTPASSSLSQLLNDPIAPAEVLIATGGDGENALNASEPVARLMFEFRNLSTPWLCSPRTSLQNSISTSPQTIAVVVASAGMIRPAVTLTA